MKPLSLVLLAMCITIVACSRSSSSEPDYSDLKTALNEFSVPSFGLNLYGRNIALLEHGKKRPIPPACQVLAPIEEFMACWVTVARIRFLFDDIDESIKKRITENYKRYPAYLDYYLQGDLILHEQTVYDDVRELYDTCQIEDCRLGSDRSFVRGWFKGIEDWLALHSNYFENHLLEKAEIVKVDSVYVNNRKYTKALINRNWKLASPIIEEAINSDDKAVHIYALGLKYNYIAAKDSSKARRLWNSLESTVFDDVNGNLVRELALHALLATSNAKTDAFYLKLLDHLAPPTCEWATNSIYEYAKRNPNKWMEKIVSYINTNQRDCFVSVLSGFNSNEPAKETVLPLLPWLEDAKWAYTNRSVDLEVPRDQRRQTLVTSLSKIPLKQAVPGLLSIIQNDRDDSLVYEAAKTLVAMNEKRGLSVIRRRMDKTRSKYLAAHLANELVKLGGISDKESVTYLARYVEQLKQTISLYVEYNPGRYLYFAPRNEKADIRVLLGQAVVMFARNKDAIAAAGLQSLALTDDILGVLAHWHCSAIQGEIIDRLLQGKIAAFPLYQLLLNKNSISNAQRAKLRTALKQGKFIAGISAVLLNDEQSYATILNGSDRAAISGLLATARIMRLNLGMALVGNLLRQNDEELKAAVYRYLVTVDSPAARRVIEESYPNSLLIIGSQLDYIPKRNFGVLTDNLELALLNEIESDSALVEIFALDSHGPFNDDRYTIKVQSNGAQLIHRKKGSGTSIISISLTEINKFKQFVAGEKIDDLGVLEKSVDHPEFYRYVHLTRKTGRRVLMISPRVTDRKYLGIVDAFKKLAKID